MNKHLAAIYGTNQEAEADTEKLAAAELAEKLASANEVDVASMTPEQIEALAASILDGAGEEEKVAEADESAEEAQEEQAEETEETQEEEQVEETEATETEETEETEEPAAEETEEESTKEASAEMLEKMAEADYLGRVMAHAFVQESRNIEKVAEEAPAAEPKKSMAGKVGSHLKNNKKKYVAGAATAALAAGGVAGRKHVAKAGKAVGAAAKKGFDAVKGKFGKKASGLSAVDTLAMARAQEILAENGVELEQEKVAGEEPETTPHDVLAQTVESRAREILVANGFTFEE
jgi:hypothetical protein